MHSVLETPFVLAFSPFRMNFSLCLSHCYIFKAGNRFTDREDIFPKINHIQISLVSNLGVILDLKLMLKWVKTLGVFGIRDEEDMNWWKPEDSRLWVEVCYFLPSLSLSGLSAETLNSGISGYGLDNKVVGGIINNLDEVVSRMGF